MIRCKVSKPLFHPLQLNVQHRSGAIKEYQLVPEQSYERKRRSVGRWLERKSKKRLLVTVHETGQEGKEGQKAL